MCLGLFWVPFKVCWNDNKVFLNTCCCQNLHWDCEKQNIPYGKKNLVINKEYTSIFQEKAKLDNLPNAHLIYLMVKAVSRETKGSLPS